MHKRSGWAHQSALVVALVVVVHLLIPGQTAAGDVSDTYVVVGTESIYKDNIPNARKLAIDNSLVTAVGLAAADMLTIDDLVTHYEEINQLLYGNISQYVQDYKVLTESRLETEYRVMVQATVSKERIKSRLTRSGILKVQKTMPRVLFFIAEQDLENSAPQYWWGTDMSHLKPVAERAIAEAMREQGIRIIDHNPRLQQIVTRSIGDDPQVDAEAAIEFGKAIQVDVVVLGFSFADKAPNVMGSSIMSYKGLVDLKAYRTKTGNEIASVNRSAVTANVDEIAGSRDALRGAGILAGEELAQQIAAAWQREGLEADRIAVQVAGTKNLANFVMFRRMLNTIAGVEDVQVKEMMADSALLSVAYKGKPRDLADALMLRAFDTFGINIYDVSADQLKVQLISNAPSVKTQR